MRHLTKAVSTFVALVVAVGCGGNGSDSPGTGSAGQAGQTGNCDMEFASKSATPFSVGMNASSMDGTMNVAIDSTPAVPIVSDHSTWNLTVTDMSGAPVPAGTKVGVKCLMSHTNIPSHGCPANITVREMGDGVYQAKPVIFNMPGHWTVTVTVDSTPVPFELCIE